MTYADMFSKVKGLFMESDVSDISEHLAFQFNITGEAEGIFYAEVKDGVLAVEPYEYFDRDAIFICSAETLFKLAEGRIDPILAFTTGKLKVEGNIDKALRLKQIIDRCFRRYCCSRGRRQCVFLQEDHDALQCQEGAHDEDVRG